MSNNVDMSNYTRADWDTTVKGLVEKGLVIDSGQRRRNPRTGKMEIVWVAVPPMEVRQ